MDITVVCGLGLFLVGLGLVWGGIRTARPSRAEAYDPDTHQLRRRSRADRWLSLIAWMLMGLGCASLGLIVLRYSPDLVVPAGAPLIDQVIWALFPVGGGSSIVLFEGVWALRAAEKKRVHREHAHEP